ncbi:MAG: tyrosine-type recombinase/integrase [Acidobacteriota bacterium]|nr:tyrosine-type recombinase/integrase [Acidobacteriota bacterium]
MKKPHSEGYTAAAISGQGCLLMSKQAQIQQWRAVFERRSASPGTRAQVTSILNGFERYLALMGTGWETVTPALVQTWRDRLLSGQPPATRRLAPATVALRLSVVRSFYGFLVAQGVVAMNPAAAEVVATPRATEVRAAAALSVHQVRRLLAAPDVTTLRGARDAAVLHLLAYLGLRRAEVCALRMRDVVAWPGGRDARTPTGAPIPWGLRVRGKGGRERLLPLPAACKAALDRYLKLDAGARRALRGDGPDAPLVQATGRDRATPVAALTPETIRLIVRRYAEYCGFLTHRRGETTRISPHSFRRTAITRALDLGVSYREIQAMTGHRSIATVERYDANKFSLERNAVLKLDYQDERRGLTGALNHQRARQF